MPLDPLNYPAPRVTVGGWLDDELLGSVQVGGYHSAPISWPYRRRTGAHSLILCGSLVRAVRQESAKDVAEAFGVSGTVVASWRRALGVDRQNNAGTQRLYRELAPQKLTLERAARGREAAMQPEALARARETIAQGMATRAPHPMTINWTPEMDAQLGTMPDAQAAEALGVSVTKINVRRRVLGIPSYAASHTTIRWTPEMDARLGTAFDGDLAAEWGVSRPAVALRRHALGIPSFGRGG